MIISDQLLAELTVRNKSYAIICDLFGLTEEERSKPNAGDWIVDRIKQYQTSTALYQNILNKAHLTSPLSDSPLDKKETPLG